MITEKSGLMQYDEMIDSLVVDCQEAVGHIVKREYIAWCKRMYEIVQKLMLLKQGVKNDLDGRDAAIASLKDELRAAGREVEDLTPEELVKEMSDTND